MKKIFFSCMGLLALCFIDASPVGNPAAPLLVEEGFFISPDSWVDLRIGYEGNFISNGRMRQRVESSGRVDRFKKISNSATMTFNLLDRLDIYGVVGVSRFFSNWRISSPLARIEMETNNRFSWAAGAKATLFEWSRTALAVGGRYSKASPGILWVTSNGTPTSTTEGSSFRFREWQVDLGLSHQVDIFIPYIAVQYTKAKARIKNVPEVIIANNGTGDLNMRNKDRVGIALGVSLTNNKKFMLNVEARLISEEALTISGDIRF